MNRVAEKKDGGPPEKPHLQEDPVVARLVSGSAPKGLTSFTGLLGRSTKPGRWLLYPSLDMSLSIEIAEEDIVHSEHLPAEKSPFGSLGGTRIFVKKGAEVTTTRTVSHTHEAGVAGDDFDLDIRLGGGGSEPKTICAATPMGTNSTCDTCATHCGTCHATCETCATHCGTCHATCVGTCNTCETQCQQFTCVGTCDNTCRTCNTCHKFCAPVTLIH